MAQERPYMPPCVIGLLAHVDAGKTTLSEALLYAAGAIRAPGRVDHGDAFLDTHALERRRGITIFAKQAVLDLPEGQLLLMDTPGHGDFTAETERVLPVLDGAVLVIDRTAGIQAHTWTLWRLLRKFQVPTFLFINKMDLPGREREELLSQLQQRLGDQCVDFSAPWSQIQERAALCDEALLESYLATGAVTPGNIQALICQGKLFPCCFGSALKGQGSGAFLRVLTDYAPRRDYPPEFAARVYKIGRDPQGTRLTFMKITGGVLRPRMGIGQEKVQQIRLCSGAGYDLLQQAPAGTVCAVTGLEATYIGQGLGAEPPAPPPTAQGVMTYRVASAMDPVLLLPKLRQLEEEDPQLALMWDDQLKQIHLRLMGQVQQEVLKALVKERFGVEIQLLDPKILYMETIDSAVEGVGHFEPLRHYAEVHILLEPLPPGSGLVFHSDCPADLLDQSYQSLVLAHMAQRTHRGVLIGAPITDMKLTLVAGKAHLRHTEGGDFRQATYRAIRQGLMQAKSHLLEPWYDFALTVPSPQIGRAIADIRAMGGRFQPPETDGGFATLTGTLPASELGDYPQTLAAYTQGQGQIQLSLAGWAPCHDEEQVIAQAGYDPLADPEHTPDSVFCRQGAAYRVPWDRVREHMHLESVLKAPRPQLIRRDLDIREKELEALLRRQFGDMTTRLYRPVDRAAPGDTVSIRPPRQQYLIVDGYNMIFAWQDLAPLADRDLDAARRRLCDRLGSYARFKKCRLVVVFDGYKQKGSPGSQTGGENIQVRFTREGQTADSYIQALVAQTGGSYPVRAATSDAMIQLSSLGAGVLRLSARELEAEVAQAEEEMRLHFHK